MDVVTRETYAELSDHFNPIKIPLQLQYFLSDPLAVNLVFQEKTGDEVPWQVSREMLDQALLEKVGEGDVQLWPMNEERLGLFLDNANGESALLSLDSFAVRDFLAETEKLLPIGEEEFFVQNDLDEWLEGIL